MPQACCIPFFFVYSAIQQWSLNNRVGTICSALMCKKCEAQTAFVELTYKLLIYYLMDFSKSSRAAFSCHSVLYSAFHMALETACWCFTLMKEPGILPECYYFYLVTLCWALMHNCVHKHLPNSVICLAILSRLHWLFYCPYHDIMWI